MNLQSQNNYAEMQFLWGFFYSPLANIKALKSI